MNRRFVLAVSLFSLAWAAGLPAVEPDSGKKEFLENEQVRIGVDLESGGSLFFLAERATGRNLLNHYDRGRFIQQSYYGDADGSDWNGKPWRWNPVQGGDWRGRPAKVLERWLTDQKVLYVRSTPVNWAGGQDLETTQMEEWIRLDGPVVHVQFRFLYNGTHRHAARHQEMPAVFVDHDLANLVMYAGEKPWTGGALKKWQPGWPNESARAAENWAAYVDERDWGLGVYFPGTPELTCYRFAGDPGPLGAGCSYFAPLRTLAVAPEFEVRYSIALTIGKIPEIRSRFEGLRSQVFPLQTGGRVQPASP